MNGAAEGYADCAAIAEKTGRPAILAGLDVMKGWSGEAYLPRLNPKTFVICDDTDRTDPLPQIQLLWSNIAYTQLAVLPGCAHAAHLEKPDLFHHLMLDYLPAP